MIYFDVESKKAILGRTSLLLAPGGYLLLGGAETTMGLDDSFEPLSLDSAVCFRRRSTVAGTALSQGVRP
jgi:chemotaxis protein methyltransferase CheR